MIHALALLSPLFVTEAQAADVFSEDLVEIVSPGALKGDGGTVILRVLALQSDGAPLMGLKLTPSASEGEVEGWKSEGGGWYTFRFTAPETERPIDVTLTVKNSDYTATLDVPVMPAGSGRINVASMPPKLVLGEVETTKVRFELEGLADSVLTASVSSGTLSDLKSDGGGVYTATYTTPAVNYPHLALVTVTAADQEGVIGQGVIELQGAVDFPMTGAPGSEVSLVIAGETYGPTTMDSSGAGAVPIIVSPGVNDATKLQRKDGKVEREAFDLQIPATRRMSWVPTPAVPADGEEHLLYVAIRKPKGAPDLAAEPTVTASTGSVGMVRHLRDGLYSVPYSAPADASGEVTLEARLGSSDQAKSELTVTLLPALPDAADGGAVPALSEGPLAQIIAVASDSVVDKGATVPVRIAAVDRYGYPIAGVAVKLSVEGGTAPAATTTGPDGTASVSVKAQDAGLMRIAATVDDRRTETSVLVGDDLSVAWPRSPGLQGVWEGLDTTAGKADPVVAAKPDPVMPNPVEPDPVKPGPTQTKAPSDHEIPWVRIRGGVSFGSYTYDQSPEGEPGPLLPARLVVGGEGGSAAPLIGFEADARAWFIPYFGAHMSLSANSYSITADAFADAPVDTLVRFQTDLNGRYPIALGDNQLWIGLNAGLEIDDFIVFRGCLDPGCRVEYEPLTVPSLDMGGEIGLEMGPVFVIGGISQGLAYGSTPYRLGGELDVGFELGERFFLDVGGKVIGRNIPLISTETSLEIGAIKDRQVLGHASVGVQF